MKQAINFGAFCLDQVVDQTMLECGNRKIEAFNRVTTFPVVEAIDAWCKELDEVSVFKQETAFVLAHDKLLNEPHTAFSFFKLISVN